MIPIATTISAATQLGELSVELFDELVELLARKLVESPLRLYMSSESLTLAFCNSRRRLLECRFKRYLKERASRPLLTLSVSSGLVVLSDSESSKSM